MIISDFRNFGFLTLKNQYFNFSEINDQKIYNFVDIWKTGILVIELRVTNSCTKFQAKIFIFGCKMAQKTIDGNDEFFLKLCFWNSQLSYDKTNDIFGILRKKTEK